jgi:hypothetical protein
MSERGAQIVGPPTRGAVSLHPQQHQILPQLSSDPRAVRIVYRQTSSSAGRPPLPHPQARVSEPGFDRLGIQLESAAGALHEPQKGATRDRKERHDRKILEHVVRGLQGNATMTAKVSGSIGPETAAATTATMAPANRAARVGTFVQSDAVLRECNRVVMKASEILE